MPTPTINQYDQSTIYDADGQPVLVIGSREFTVIEQDGSISEHKEGDYLQLVDGLAWNPRMMTGNHPVLLTSCSICRKPRFRLWKKPSHGLLSVRNVRICADCGRRTCPRHRWLAGKAWRCRRCAFIYTIKGILGWLLLTEE